MSTTTRPVLAAALLQFARPRGPGVVFGAETGFVVERDPDSVLGADVAFVSRERLATVENLDKFVPLGPDLAVGVLGPSNTAVEMDEKIALHFGAGSRAVWVINPHRRTVSVYTSPFEVRIPGERDALEGGDLLPGFSHQVSELFADVK